MQVMVEGSHVPLNKVQVNNELEQDWCSGAPFYTLGAGDGYRARL